MSFYAFFFVDIRDLTVDLISRMHTQTDITFILGHLLNSLIIQLNFFGCETFLLVLLWLCWCVFHLDIAYIRVVLFTIYREH